MDLKSIQIVITDYYIPVTGSNFDSSKELLVTFEVLDERTVHSTDVLLTYDLLDSVNTVIKRLGRRKYIRTILFNSENV